MLLGKYRISSVLGVGGMGFVLAATHLRMGGPVALKMLLPELAVDPTFVERFAREANSASKIRSEHVARVLDVETLDDGLPLIVMELLDGHDLAKEVELNGPLPLERAAEFVLQACEALAEAHSLGIIHRDLKPANLFLTQRADGSELIKVMDFGIAKALSDTGGPSLTETQDVVGSPLYMSPEQLRSSKDVDVRTDVWSLGVILYELVSGDVPFGGSSSAAVLAAVAADRPRPIEELLPEAPLALVQLLDKALQKSPDDRHANVADFAQELGPLAPENARISTDRVSRIIYGNAGPPRIQAQSDAAAMTMIAPGSSSRATPPASVNDLKENSQNPSRRASRRLRWAAVGSVGIAAAAGGSLLLLPGPTEQGAERDSRSEELLAPRKNISPPSQPSASAPAGEDEPLAVNELTVPKTRTELDARSAEPSSNEERAPDVETAPPPTQPTPIKARKASLPLIQTTKPQTKMQAPVAEKEPERHPSLIEQATETRK